MNELGYYSSTLMFHPAGHLLQKLLYRHPSVTEPVSTSIHLKKLSLS